MKNDISNKWKTIMDREKIMAYNETGCPACGRKFTLGDPVVYACGDWKGPLKLIHENEAVFDQRSETYVERSCYEAGGAR